MANTELILMDSDYKVCSGHFDLNALIIYVHVEAGSYVISMLKDAYCYSNSFDDSVRLIVSCLWVIEIVTKLSFGIANRTTELLFSLRYCERIFSNF